MEIKHKTIFGLNIDAIRLKDFGRDENCLKGENKLGEKFEDHTFLLHNHYFDHISLRVWETDFDKPEYIKLTKKYTAKERTVSNQVFQAFLKHFHNENGRQNTKGHASLSYNIFHAEARFRFSKTDKFSGLNFESISDMNHKKQGGF